MYSNQIIAAKNGYVMSCTYHDGCEIPAQLIENRPKVIGPEHLKIIR
jgi:hypothetical protein